MLEEISDSIKSMQSGKSPGPDGFPVELKKKKSLQRTYPPFLLSTVNESSGHLPEIFTQKNN